jgi:hypothetical protein
MAWWAPWTWFRGNKEGTAEERGEEFLPPEFSEERAVSWSWWRPWTWFRRGAEREEGEKLLLPELPGEGARPWSWWRPWMWFRRGTAEPGGVEAGLPPEEELEAYRPTTRGPGVARERPIPEKEFPELERERPSKKVMVEEEPEVFLPEEEEYPGGIFISDRKVQGGFTKFCLSLFSIFLLPFILVFGLCLVTCAFLLIFPILIAFFPIFLIGLFVLFVIVPVALPVLIVYLLVTERSELLINSKGCLFTLRSLPAEGKRIPSE